MNFQLTTSPQTRVYPQHAHCVFDQNQTTVDAGHAHAVINGMVQPSPQDGHTHGSTGTQCQQYAPPPGMGQQPMHQHGQAPKKPCNCGRK